MALADPMEDGAQGDEGDKGSGEFLVAGGYAAVALEGAKEILHVMPMTIVAAMKGAPFFARGIQRQAREDILLHEQVA